MQNHIGREEATLEPTPPVKRMYRPPSIRVLFLQNQCKSSFRRLTGTTIKTYTFQYNNNMIHNFSKHTLTDAEFSVLTKDFSFVPTPPKLSNKK